MDEKLKRKLEEQVLGSHMCCIYRNKNEQLSLASNYILMGLKRGERCVYIVDDRTKEEVIEALRGLEVDIDHYIDSRQLVFLTKKNSYLKDGYFDPDEMIELLRKNEEKAFKDGFNGLRVTGEMTWVLTDLPGTERLMEYEAKLNQFFPGSRSMGLCQYNENKFSQEILVDVIHTHPVVVIYDSIYDNHRYVPPELFLARIKGEVQEEQYESIKNDVIEREVLVEKEKERREELRRSKELVSNIIESTSIPMFVIDSDHKLIHWNRACERLTGISSDEIVGTKDLWKAFYHEERPVLADLIVEEASEDEVAEFYEGKYSKMKLIDGAYEAEDFFPQFGEQGRWVYFTAAPLLDSNGEIIGAVETLQDITERKETEEELRELNRFRERIIQDVNIWLDVLDKDANVLVWNKAAERISGYSKDEVVGHDKVWEWLYPDEEYRKKVSKRVSEIMEGKDVDGYETTIDSKDGYKKIISWTSHHLIDEEGKVMGSIALGKDITERKETEEELRELSRFKERIIRDVNVWLDVLDKDANVLVWNKAAERISGYSKEEVVGHDGIWEWLYPDEEYRKKVTDRVSKRLEGEGYKNYEETHETTIVSKGGEEKVISWTSHILNDDKGDIIGFIALGKDITAQKRAKEKKEFLDTLLRQDLSSKSQVAMGYIQLLDDSELSEENRKNLMRALKAEREVQEILGLARELRDIDHPPELSFQNIRKILEHVMKNISEVLKLEGVSIEKEYEKDISNVKGGYSLHDLFSRLLKARILAPKCNLIRISVEEENEEVIVNIEDDGEPLEEDLKDLLFGDIYTGETTGVGGARYYMIKQLAKYNEVDILAKDSELGGARFEIYLKKV